jgi:putative transposase
MTDMKKSKYSEEQIIGFLEQVDAGMPIKGLSRKGAFSEATFNKQRAESGVVRGSGRPDPQRRRPLSRYSQNR